jgi:hypothetical protein
MTEAPQSFQAGDFGLSMAAASSLCGWSERTLWRKLAAGHVRRHRASRMRAGIAWSSLLPYLQFSLDAETLALLKQADAGCALSQAELALQLIRVRQSACALYWLRLAAEAGQSDAMYWMGRAQLCGEGVAIDRNLGLMWMARSAAAGHAISDAILTALSHPSLSRPTLTQPRQLTGVAVAG